MMMEMMMAIRMKIGRRENVDGGDSDKYIGEDNDEDE